MSTPRAPKPPAWTRPLEPPACPPGWRTGPPDFVGVGTQRSGTSWWLRAVETHPDVARPEGRDKELHYFNRLWDGEPPGDFVECYHRMFPRPPGTITGEWTPGYMYYFWAAPLLARAAPAARILAIFRDPVERYLSGLSRAVRRARKEGRAIAMAELSDAIYRSLYHGQMERLLKWFPREQVLVLQYERCRADVPGELARTHRFLGLEPVAATPARVDARSRPQRWKPELSGSQCEELVASMRDDVARFAELCPEIDLSLWPNFRDL